MAVENKRVHKTNALRARATKLLLFAARLLEAALAADHWTHVCRLGNQEIYRRLRLVPRVMRNVADVSMATTILGQASSFPVYISGAAKVGFAHPDAEIGLCKAAHAAGIILSLIHI